MPGMRFSFINKSSCENLSRQRKDCAQGADWLEASARTIIHSDWSQLHFDSFEGTVKEQKQEVERMKE